MNKSLAKHRPIANFCNINKTFWYRGKGMKFQLDRLARGLLIIIK